MTKAERDKLREEINSRKLYISSNELIDRNVLLGLLDHIDALEGHIRNTNDAIVAAWYKIGCDVTGLDIGVFLAASAIASAPEVK